MCISKCAAFFFIQGQFFARYFWINCIFTTRFENSFTLLSVGRSGIVNLRLMQLLLLLLWIGNSLWAGWNENQVETWKWTELRYSLKSIHFYIQHPQRDQFNSRLKFWSFQWSGFFFFVCFVFFLCYFFNIKLHYICFVKIWMREHLESALKKTTTINV